jgi:hypothetical protein
MEMETETETNIIQPFLDILVNKILMAHKGHAAYRKPTYLHMTFLLIPIAKTLGSDYSH